MIKSKPIYKCPNCGNISEVVLKDKIYALLISSQVLSLCIVIFDVLFGENALMVGLFLVLFIFGVFYGLVPYMITLEGAKLIRIKPRWYKRVISVLKVRAEKAIEKSKNLEKNKNLEEESLEKESDETGKNPEGIDNPETGENKGKKESLKKEEVKKSNKNLETKKNKKEDLIGGVSGGMGSRGEIRKSDEFEDIFSS